MTDPAMTSVQLNLLNGDIVTYDAPGDAEQVTEALHDIFEHGGAVEVQRENRILLVPVRAIATVIIER